MTTDPNTFTEAYANLAGRAVTPSARRTAEWSNEPVAIRQRAFFSAGVESAAFLTRSQGFLTDYLGKVRDPATGGLAAQGRQQFVAEMREFAIREGLGKVDPKTGSISPTIRESDLTDLRSIARLQLIFDTMVESAQEYGYWKQGLDPAVLATYPAARFIRVRPVMTPRPYHVMAEGAVRLKTDLNFWLSMNRDFGVPWGPWGFNSGMGTEDVGRTEAESLGLIKPGEKIDPAPLQPFNSMFNASAGGLSPATRAPVVSLGGATITCPSAAPALAPRASTAQGTPVSAAVTTAPRTTRKEKAVVQEALDTIALVHGDGILPQLPVRFAKGDEGHYKVTRKIAEIKVGKDTEHQVSQAVHEIGHFLDHRGIPGNGLSSNIPGGEVAGVLAAIKASDAYSNLVNNPHYLADPKYRRYQLHDFELFARAYTQFIAEESGHLGMQAEILKRRAGRTGYWPDSQWGRLDFVPIRNAMRTLFKKLNWMKP